MVAVHVGQQHQMNGAQPRVVATRHAVPGVVKETDTRRVLENHRTVVRAQLARMGADGCNLDGLRKRRKGGQQEGEYSAGDLHVMSPEKFYSGSAAGPRRCMR